MKQIREKELERANGGWNMLSPGQQREHEVALQHLGLMGRHRNILANYTIYTLEIITRDIRTIFCHDIMVDRIAGMLNYFLKHLVRKDLSCSQKGDISVKTSCLFSHFMTKKISSKWKIIYNVSP